MRDPKRDGSIIKGGGVSRPEWMDDDEWGEYRRSAEYAYEISHVSDSEFDEPDERGDYYEEEYVEIDPCISCNCVDGCEWIAGGEICESCREG